MHAYQFRDTYQYRGMDPELKEVRDIVISEPVPEVTTQNIQRMFILDTTVTTVFVLETLATPCTNKWWWRLTLCLAKTSGTEDICLGS